MTEEKILARVRKLLAVANDDRANENERDNALRMAHNLLTKHQLTLAQVDAAHRDAEDPRGRFTEEGWSLNWAKHVRMVVSDFFMVKYFFGKKVNGTRCMHHFIGRESNATTAMWMSAYIIDSILKEGRRLYKHNLAPETRAFATGAVDRLRQRVREMKATTQTQMESDGRALVLIDLAKQESDENEAFIRAAGTKLVTHNRKQVAVDAQAYGQGHAYGDKLSLNTQVAGRSIDQKKLT